MPRTIRLLAAVLSLAFAAAAADPAWVPLFDGKTLNGWEVCNGSAKYQVENGVIVGTTVEGSPNSFLCTKAEYGDFELEFEVKTDPALNSGVQLRSHRYTQDQVVQTFDGKKTNQRHWKAGRVYGYQVEISNEESGTSGGIYDEARRGWLDNIVSNPAASKAFKDSQWNRYRVLARGNSIRTWVNGVPCAKLVDSTDRSGLIGLQVHAFNGPKPVQVRFRNLRIKDYGRAAQK
jgi:hypothetical protein